MGGSSAGSFLGHDAELTSLVVIYEATGLPAFPLPSELEKLYGGPLGVADGRLVSNFVSTIDGVAAIPGLPSSVQLLGGQSPADRFLMALLRSAADVLVVGATTFNLSKEEKWTAESLCPRYAPAFAELRLRLGKGAPRLAVVTASGNLDPRHPALAAGALVLTSDLGAERLHGRLPSASTVESLGARVDLRAAVAHLRDRGHSLILSEGGPTLHGTLLAAGLVDELFLTLSPLLAGQSPGGDRLSIVEHAELLPATRVGGRLLSARRAGAHLFLRYELTAR
jgi:riboflavin biosynthesis pyrimidine reductase